MKSLPAGMARVLVRSTNWIGDAVMTTPAIRTIRQNCPGTEITLLALPWVCDVFQASPHIDRILRYEKNGRHAGLRGKFTLAGELRREGFDAAILLQNAFEAAFISFLAGIPVRAGYTTDARGLLLTHGVRKKAAIGKQHQVHYYQEMLRGLGFTPGPDELELTVPEDARRWAETYLRTAGEGGAGQIVGINPGAAYGPAKRWPVAKFAGLVKQLCATGDNLVVIFGTEADSEAAGQIRRAGDEHRVIDLTGRTTLAQAMGLIGMCSVFVTNDSGLMHVSAALHTPTVAVFGSTDHVATGPYSNNATVVRKDLDCSPCLETHCPKKHFRCMEDISVEDVLQAVHGQLALSRLS